MADTHVCILHKTVSKGRQQTLLLPRRVNESAECYY